MRAINPEERTAEVLQQPRTSKVRVFFLVVLPVLVLIAAIAGFLYLKSTKPEVAKRPVREQVFAVSAMPVSVSSHKPRIKLFGEAQPGRRVELRALVAGEILETGTTFLEGGVVKKDDLLLQIDPFEFQTALSEAIANLSEAEARLAESEARIALEQDQLAEARRQLELAQVDLERARPLVKQGLLSQKAVDDRQVLVSQRDQAVKQRVSSIAIENAKAAQQRAQIERLKASVSRAERNLLDARLVAPFDAYIWDKAAEVGRLIGANDRVATLIDANRIDVKFNLPDAQYGRLVTDRGGLEGRPVTVIWRVGGEAVQYAAKVERVAAQIAAASGGVDVFARVERIEGRVPLRVGAFVEIYLDGKEFSDVVTLPETALYAGNTVYVIEENRLKSRIVELVGYSGGDVLVRGDLKPAEQVVTTRISEIGDGLRVEVR